MYAGCHGVHTGDTRERERESDRDSPASIPSCAAAGGDVPGQGFHWAPAVTAAVAEKEYKSAFVFFLMDVLRQ